MHLYRLETNGIVELRVCKNGQMRDWVVVMIVIGINYLQYVYMILNITTSNFLTPSIHFFLAFIIPFTQFFLRYFFLFIYITSHGADVFVILPTALVLVSALTAGADALFHLGGVLVGEDEVGVDATKRCPGSTDGDRCACVTLLNTLQPPEYKGRMRWRLRR